MVIKSYVAATAAAALKQVRTELGPDAIILRTVQTDDTGHTGVEITACTEKVTAAFDGGPRKQITQQPAKQLTVPQPKVAPALSPMEDPIMKRLDVAELLANIESKLDVLVHHTPSQPKESTAPTDAPHAVISRLRNLDFSALYIDRILKAIPLGSSDEDVLNTAATAISDSLHQLIAPCPEFKKGDSVLFYGLAGCGLQSLMAAVSAHIVAERGQKVELAGIDLTSPGKRTNSEKKITLLHAPLLPLEASDKQSLQFVIEQMQPTYRILVVSAMHRAEDLLDWREQFAALHPTHLGITMADRCKRFGSWLSLADAMSIPVILGTKGFATNASLMNIDPSVLMAGLVASEGVI